MSAQPLHARLALPAQLRLSRLAALESPDELALAYAMSQPRMVRARRELISDGRPISEPQLIVDGWAARIRLMPDGRRQILSFLLPGDLIGLCDYHGATALTTVIAITDVDVCVAPAADISPALARAYALSRAIDDKNLVAQITRLGRMNAQERIVDFLLELLERLELAGLASNSRYLLPLTQEVIADALGLTSVHVNRTLQALRREGSITWTGREIDLPNAVELGRSIGRPVVRIARDQNI